MMDRKTTLLLKLTSTYCVFGCKKCISEKCYMRNSFGFTVVINNTCKGFFGIDYSHILEGGITKFGLDAFYNCKGYLLKENTLLSDGSFKSAQKNLPRCMVNTKQPTVYLVYKHHHLHLRVSCVRSYMGVAFEGVKGNVQLL